MAVNTALCSEFIDTLKFKKKNYMETEKKLFTLLNTK